MIEVNNISVSFKNNTVLKEFNTMFYDNQIYCVVGQSGAGKTTLLRSIAGLQSLDEGKITFNGKIVKKPIKEITMMHQKYSNFPWLTCFDNVALPFKILKQKVDNDKCMECLELVGLRKYAKSYPHELSGGMQQRLALARLFNTEYSKVYLMDEPLSALDGNTRHEMQELLLRNQRKTKSMIIMITHDMQEAEKLTKKENIITVTKQNS